ncbi:Hypothetical predicted protein [Octopus vulgaris]|uniref:Uncharacterized protein n=1 Tax=Octopus vulgaris TaxID=6645 RepID=A0AA36FL86_OCTVU|nr:Hypothetical predicted protein [Octopus vulgaris]
MLDNPTVTHTISCVAVLYTVEHTHTYLRTGFITGMTCFFCHASIIIVLVKHPFWRGVDKLPKLHGFCGWMPFLTLTTLQSGHRVLLHSSGQGAYYVAPSPTSPQGYRCSAGEGCRGQASVQEQPRFYLA